MCTAVTVAASSFILIKKMPADSVVSRDGGESKEGLELTVGLKMKKRNWCTKELNQIILS